MLALVDARNHVRTTHQTVKESTCVTARPSEQVAGPKTATRATTQLQLFESGSLLGRVKLGEIDAMEHARTDERQWRQHWSAWLADADCCEQATLI